MRPEAEFMKLEYSLDLSQRTSQGILKLKKKTRQDVAKILWECERQMKLINVFSETDAFYWMSGDRKYHLNRHYIDAENIYYELSQK